MSKKDIFIQCVTAGAIIRDIREGRSVAPTVISDAHNIDEFKLNMSVDTPGFMAEEYLHHVYRSSSRDTIPEWLK